MPEVSAKLVKELRDTTGAAFLDCKKTLEETKGDFEKAKEVLRIKGLAKAEKKLGRETPEGIITSYIHAGGRIGVLVEVNCETDFVARNPEFQNLAKEVAMQIAATNPKYVSRDNVPQDVVEKERNILKAQVLESGKPEHVAGKIVEGRLDKFFEEVCLLEQPSIRDPKLKVSDMIKSFISKVGENIIVRRFVRFQLGEPVEE